MTTLDQEPQRAKLRWYANFISPTQTSAHNVVLRECPGQAQRNGKISRTASHVGKNTLMKAMQLMSFAVKLPSSLYSRSDSVCKGCQRLFLSWLRSRFCSRAHRHTGIAWSILSQNGMIYLADVFWNQPVLYARHVCSVSLLWEFWTSAKLGSAKIDVICSWFFFHAA